MQEGQCGGVPSRPEVRVAVKVETEVGSGSLKKVNLAELGGVADGEDVEAGERGGQGNSQVAG